MAAETSQTLDRGLRVLEVLADASDGLTVTELAAALDVSRTVIYRLVVTLEQHAFLRRTADGKCRLGLAVLSLGRQVQPLVRDASAPVLRRLADATASTAALYLADGTDSLVIAIAEPAKSDVHVALRVGTRAPLEMGAAGRSILAARTAAGRPLDPPWVISTGEPHSGAYGVAAPLTTLPGLEASIGVVSFGECDEADVGPKVARAAAELTRMLR